MTNRPLGYEAKPDGAEPASAGSALASPGLALELRLPRVRRLLLTAMGVIVGLDLLASIGAALGAPYTLTRFFDGDDKVNFPTGYKTAFLLAAALLFAALALWGRRHDEAFAPGWRLLALVTGFAFVDETVWLHQSISGLVHRHWQTQGFLTYAWTLLYVPFGIAVAVVLVKHLRHLGPVDRWPMLTGGMAYAIGAIAFEPIKSKLADSAGEDALVFRLVACVSDSLEMIGLTVLVIALLGQLARRAGSVAVTLADE